MWRKGQIHKRKKNGILGNMLDCIENYLNDKQQKLYIEGFSNTFKSIDARVSYV